MSCHRWSCLAALSATICFGACSKQPEITTGGTTGEPSSTTTDSATGAAPDTPFPIQAIIRAPRPGASAPRNFSFAPDDTYLTFLDSEDNSRTRKVYRFDIKSGERTALIEPPKGSKSEAKLSLEDRLRRERTRERGLGITRYSWAKKAPKIVVPAPGTAYIFDAETKTVSHPIPATHRPVSNPQISQDGSALAYVYDSEVHVVDLVAGKGRQVTKGAKAAGVNHGTAEYVAQEEMGRHAGYWLSHDAAWVAFTEVDTKHIPAYRIMHQGSDNVGTDAQEDHRYPFAGKANAHVRLAVTPASGGKPRWLDTTMDAIDGDLPYIARVQWADDGKLWVQVEDREQHNLDLLRFDPASGKREHLLREQSDIWINLHRMLHPLVNGDANADGFLWASERSGYRHLYLYDASGKEVRALTSGEWVVLGVAGIDHSTRTVYFIGTKDTPLQRHLYAVSLDGGDIRRVTEVGGSHAVTLDHKFEHFVDTVNSLDAPAKIYLRRLADGKIVQPLHDKVDPRIAKLGLTPPRLVTLNSRDGTQLHGAIYEPSRGSPPFPTVVSVYGGPHAQRVTETWGQTSDLRAQYLRGLGFLVFKLDNRGSANRGLEFEGAIRHDLGNLEVQDQVDGVRWLVEQGLADPQRVGMYGWSYGGYMSAMSLARAPDTFKVAVAGAPVTHWDGYDTHYTERYMGLPDKNAEGYKASSVMTHLDAMQGRLLLIHGLLDENVHFRHSARLISALIATKKTFEVEIFPDERHGPRKKHNRLRLENRIANFFRDNL